jgi:hypothetical protein
MSAMNERVATERWSVLSFACGFDPEDDSGALHTLRPPPSEDAVATLAPALLSAPWSEEEGDGAPTVALPAASNQTRLSPAKQEQGIVAWGVEFQLEGPLGEGGMGVVYRALEGSLHRPVAIKVLKRGSPHEFVAEARVTAFLDHPNIVPVYTLGASESGALHLVMKRIEGRPWSDLLPETPGAEGLDRHLEVFRGVLDAMAFAHERGIVHRDLKPQNVMVGDYGQTYLVDWGLACDVSAGPQAGTRGAPTAESIRGSVAGTAAYMSPEMAGGELLTAATDVYLLGAILYELLCGRPPHRGASLINVVCAALANELFPLEPAFKAPPALVAMATRCLHSDPSQRFASAVELREAFRHYLSGEADREASDALCLRAREAFDAAAAVAAPGKRYAPLFDAEGLAQEALRLWPQSEKAEALRVEVGEALVSCAVRVGDTDLAETLLQRLPAKARHDQLAKGVAARSRELDPKAMSGVREMREHFSRRLHMMVVISWLMVLTIVPLSVGVFHLVPLLAIALSLLAVVAAVSATRLMGPLRRLTPTQREPYEQLLRHVGLAAKFWLGAAGLSMLSLQSMTARSPEAGVALTGAIIGLPLGFFFAYYRLQLGWKTRRALFGDVDWSSLGATLSAGQDSAVPMLLEFFLPTDTKHAWYVGADVPPKKLAAALASYAPDLSAEDVLALGDGTMLGSSTEGCLLTAQRLFFKGFDTAWDVALADLVSVKRRGGWPSYKIRLQLLYGEQRDLECNGFEGVQLDLIRVLEGLAEMNAGTREPDGKPGSAP